MVGLFFFFNINVERYSCIITIYIPRAATSKHNFPLCLTESPYFLALKMNIIHGKRNYDINKRVSRIFQAAHLFNEVKKLPMVSF